MFSRVSPWSTRTRRAGVGDVIVRDRLVSALPAWRDVDAYVLLEIRRARTHCVKCHAAPQTGAPDPSRDGAKHDVGRGPALSGKAGGDTKPRDIGIVRDGHLAHQTQTARLAENGQPRARRMLNVNKERQLAQSRLRVAS